MGRNLWLGQLLVVLMALPASQEYARAAFLLLLVIMYFGRIVGGADLSDSWNLMLCVEKVYVVFGGDCDLVVARVPGSGMLIARLHRGLAIRGWVVSSNQDSLFLRDIVCFAWGGLLLVQDSLAVMIRWRHNNCRFGTRSRGILQNLWSIFWRRLPFRNA